MGQAGRKAAPVPLQVLWRNPYRASPESEKVQKRLGDYSRMKHHDVLSGTDHAGPHEVCYYYPIWMRDYEYSSLITVSVFPSWALDEDKTISLTTYNSSKQYGSSAADVYLTAEEVDKFIEVLQEAKRRLKLYIENGGQEVPMEELNYPFA